MGLPLHGHLLEEPEPVFQANPDHSPESVGKKI